jgi:Arc/MetJ-type ribon-helix-helix transcriptional regulator
MKVSVSLPEVDVEFLDAYARTEGYPSRSAVLQKAIRLLRATELTNPYQEAWGEWAASREASNWEVTIGDGLNA